MFLNSLTRQLAIDSVGSQINVVFNDGPTVQMLGEVQIHLASTHALKQQEHVFYEIRRAKSIAELRPKT